MDFERLERAWRSSANSPGEAATIYLTEEMMESLEKRRRQTQGFIGLVGLALVLWAAKIVYDILVNPFPFDLRREWAAIPLLILPWASLFVIRAQHRRHLAAHPDPYSSMPATLRALVDENETEQRRLRFGGGMFLLTVLLLALALRQLLEVGKMEPQHVLQGSILFTVILGSIAAYQIHHYFRRLLPENRRLRRLLADYRQEAAD